MATFSGSAARFSSLTAIFLYRHRLSVSVDTFCSFSGLVATSSRSLSILPARLHSTETFPSSPANFSGSASYFYDLAATFLSSALTYSTFQVG